MSARIATRVCLLIAALALSGCKRLHDVSAHLRHDVPSRLTGVWTVIAAGEGQTRGTLELHSDGSFVANRLPDDILNVDSSSDETISGTGNWTFQRDTDPRHVVLLFRTVRGIEHPPTLPAHTELTLEESGQTPQLSTHIGDPDEDERIALELTDAGEGTAK